jgi:hypothetical protein
MGGRLGASQSFFNKGNHVQVEMDDVQEILLKLEIPLKVKKFFPSVLSIGV